MIPCFYKLNLDIQNILKIDVNKVFLNNFLVQSYDNKEWINFFSNTFIDEIEKNFPIQRMMLFNKPSNWNNTDAHIDPEQIYAINIVFPSIKNTSESKMEWFKVKVNVDKPLTYSQAKTPYVSFKEDEIELLESQCLDNIISIVRVDIPHRIKIGTGHRTCFSFRMKSNFKNWDEVYEFYKSLY